MVRVSGKMQELGGVYYQKPSNPMEKVRGGRRHWPNLAGEMCRKISSIDGIHPLERMGCVPEELRDREICQSTESVHRL
jgi:hypothetical protein